MNSAARLLWLALIVSLIVSQTTLAQSLFYVKAKIDLRSNHATAPKGSDIGSASFDRSSQVPPLDLERFDVGANNNHNFHGFYYPNVTRNKTIRGIRIRVEDPTRYRFDPAECNGGALFTNCQVVDDGKEVIFGAGVVPPGETTSSAIMYINIQPYSDLTGRVIWYRGEALTSDPLPISRPIAKDDVLAQRWYELAKVCPSNYLQPEAYGMDDDKRYICMWGGGDCHLFDSKSQKLLQVNPARRANGGMVNRITFKHQQGSPGTFVLWHNGHSVGTVNPESLEVYRTYNHDD